MNTKPMISNSARRFSRNSLRTGFLAVLAVSGLLLLTHCGDDDDDNEDFNPVVTGLDPESGAPRTQVTIFGNNLSNDPASVSVSFGGTDAPVLQATPTQIITRVPEGIEGQVDVTLEVRGTTTSALSFTVVDPSITSISPASASAGSSITISGENFASGTGGNQVFFGETEATVTSGSEEQVLVTVPGLDPGTYEVTVVAFGLISEAESFEIVAGPPNPGITAVTPEGGTQAGNIITIRGANFDPVPGNNVITFTQGTQSINATPTEGSTTQLNSALPESLALGEVSIGVTVEDRASNTVNYSVILPPPSVTAVSPSNALPGNEITILGNDFGTDPSVVVVRFRIGGIDYTPATVTNTQITITVPEELTPGPYFINVLVDGQRSAGTVDFEVLPGPPTITGFSPSSAFPGSTITVEGENFSANASIMGVVFGAVNAEVLNSTETSIVVVVPAGLPAGETQVRVFRGEAESAPVAFTVDPIPVAVRTVYWNENAGNAILRGTITDTGADIEVLYNADDGVSSPIGLTLDFENEFIYFTNDVDISIQRGSLDGSAAIETIAVFDFDTFEGPGLVRDIALNAAGDVLFMAGTSFDNSFNDISVIQKLTIATGVTENLYFKEGRLNFEGLKLDEGNNHIYWAEQRTGSVFRGSLDGLETPVELFGTSDGLTFPQGLAIDVGNNRIFISESGSTVTDAIYSGNLDGTGSLTTIVTQGDELNAAYDLELDIENGFIHWMNPQTGGLGTLYRAGLDGSNPELLFTGINNSLFFELDIRQAETGN